MRVVVMVAGLSMLGGTAAAVPYVERVSPRRTVTADFEIPVERFEARNQLVVLLSPDPTVSSVTVQMTFRAGTLYTRPGQSGLAHLAEHVMMRGPTEETDYITVLEARRARNVSAWTSYDSVSFLTTTPAEELPLALWVAADRLGTLPGLIDQTVLDKNRAVVLQEHAARVLDGAYGSVDEQIFRLLYDPAHPLHGTVLGAPEDLAKLTLADLKDFVGRYLVPANAVLTITGNFDPQRARELIDEGLARLPPGVRAPAPQPPRQKPTHKIVEMRERLSRQPRVTFAWRIPGVPDAEAHVLAIGAALLTLHTDGSFGTRVQADFHRFLGEAIFRMDVILPHEKPLIAAREEAESFLRYLTLVEMPHETIDAAFLGTDRATLFGLDTLSGRAGILTRLEILDLAPSEAENYLERHWSAEREAVRDIARVVLRESARVTMHAVPIDGRKPRLMAREREEFQLEYEDAVD